MDADPAEGEVPEVRCRPQGESAPRKLAVAYSFSILSLLGGLLLVFSLEKREPFVQAANADSFEGVIWRFSV